MLEKLISNRDIERSQGCSNLLSITSIEDSQIIVASESMKLIELMSSIADTENESFTDFADKILKSTI